MHQKKGKDKWVGTATDIERRSHNSYTAPCNGVICHGAPIRGIRVFANHTCGNKLCKLNVSTIFARRTVFKHVYLHAQIAIHTHLRITVILIAGKKSEYPQLEPHACWDKDGAGLGSVSVGTVQVCLTPCNPPSWNMRNWARLSFGTPSML